MKTVLTIAVAIVLSFTLIPTADVSGQQVVQDQPKDAIKASITTTSPSNVETLYQSLKKQVPKDIPMMDDVSITPPDPGVPPELAGLSGAWVGEWRGERTNAHMFDHVYVVEKISATSITLASMSVGRFVGRSSNNYGQQFSNRYELRFEGLSPLQVTLPNGNNVTLKIEDDTLKTRSVRPNGGGVNVGTFKKVK